MPASQLALILQLALVLQWVLALQLTWAPAVLAAPPRSPHGELAQACTQCHTTSSWQEIHFDHETTSFPLEGQHVTVACTACHRLDDFTSAGSDCLTCHTDGHEGALESDCAVCHDPVDWTAAGFDHEMSTFPLWGAHGATACVQCHANEVTWQFSVAPETCYDCHRADFGQASVTVHLTAGPDCESCHTLDRWQGGHDPIWFEIRGGKHEADCSRCHKRPPDYLSYTCADCHKFEFDVEEHVGLDADDARCLDCHAGGFDD